VVVGPAGPMDLKDLSCHLGTYYRNLEPAALSFFQLAFEQVRRLAREKRRD
jgi:hypothetical protein